MLNKKYLIYYQPMVASLEFAGCAVLRVASMDGGSTVACARSDGGVAVLDAATTRLVTSAPAGTCRGRIIDLVAQDNSPLLHASSIIISESCALVFPAYGFLTFCRARTAICAFLEWSPHFLRLITHSFLQWTRAG